MAEEKKMPSKELIQKAMECETPEQVIELAKTEGFTLTKEAAEAFLAQTQDVELDGENLQKAAGGGNCTRCWCDMRECTLFPQLLCPMESTQ